jgi:excisionase family DNA binding protein
MTEPLLKTRDVARRFNVEMGTVIDWCQAGEIPFIRLRGRRYAPYRFRLSDIDATEEKWRQIDHNPGDNRNAPATPERPGADTGKEPSDAPRILRPVDNG